MKKVFKTMAFTLLGLVLSSNLMWAEDTQVYQNNCPKNASNSSYTSYYDATINSIKWKAPGNQYENGAWRIGGKVKDTYDRYLYTQDVISDNISKINVSHGQKTINTVNSFKLDVYSTAAKAASGGVGDVSSISQTYVDKGITTFERPTNKDWSNCFYRFTYNFTGTSTSATFVLLSSITFYKEASTPTGPSLSVDPATIDFGTVYQNAEVDAKDVTVTFANLTTNDVASAITGSVFSINKTGSFTSGDKITITPSTATLGEYEETLTVSATGVDDQKVTVTMNVVAAPAPFEGKKLTFDLSTNNLNLPTAKGSSVAGDYTYTLDDVNYTFSVTDAQGSSDGGVYFSSSYTMVYASNAIGLPAISGYKLVKVEASNSSGCSTSVQAAIKEGPTADDNDVTGGTAQTWSTQSSTYTYNLSGTDENTMYYLYVSSNKNAQITSLTLYYQELAPTNEAITFAAPEGGSLVIKNGATSIESGTTIQNGTVLDVEFGMTPAEAYKDVVIKVTNTTTSADVTSTVYNSETQKITMPRYPITVAVTFTKLYKISLETAGEGTGSATMNGVTTDIYVDGETQIDLVASAVAPNEFTSWSATENISIVAENDAETYAYALGDGTITATFGISSLQPLGTPTLSDPTNITYNSVTLNWQELANAKGYNVELLLNDVMVTSDVIIGETTWTPEVTLQANTTYTYTVQGVGDGTTYAEENNPKAQSTVKTADYPDAALTLSENGVERAWGTGLKLNSKINLPTDAATEITGKVLVGYVAENFEDTKSAEPDNMLPLGAEYTMTATEAKLFAVYATKSEGDAYYQKITAAETDWSGKYLIVSTDGAMDGSLNGGTGGVGKAQTHKTVTENDKVGENIKASFGDQYYMIIEKTGNNYYLKSQYTGEGATPYIYRTSNSNGMDASATASTAIGISWDDGIKIAGATSGNGASTLLKYNKTSGSTGEMFRFYKDGGTSQQAITLYKRVANIDYSAYVTKGTKALGKPSFDPEGGEYNTPQTITLSATEGDIYYTINDGEEKLYEEEIKLENRGQYVISAYAKKGDAQSEPNEQTYTLDWAYTLTELVAEGAPTTTGRTVTVILTNEVIESLATSGSYVNGFFTMVGDKKIEVYCQNSPAEWEVGGKVSGTVTCPWKDFKGTWELCPTNWDWASYTAPAKITSLVITNDVTNKNYTAGQKLDFTGLTVTGVYSDATEEDVTEDVVWTDVTLTENQPEATATATLNNAKTGNLPVVQSKTITGLTVGAAKTLQSIYVADDSKHKTEFFVGRPFSSDGLKVMAKYNIGEDQQIALANLTIDNPTFSAAEAEHTINISYTENDVEKTTSYNVAVKYMNLSELVAEDVPTNTSVKVAFSDVEITGFYKNSSDKRAGVYVNVIGKNGSNIELYSGGTPSETLNGWQEGGKLASKGDYITGTWKYYDGGSVWEIDFGSNYAWATNIEYTAPSIYPTGIAMSIPSAMVKQSKSLDLDAIFTPTNATVLNNLAWESDNAKVTVVPSQDKKSAKVTVAPDATVGTATITVKVDDKDGNELSATCVITIQEYSAPRYGLYTGDITEGDYLITYNYNGVGAMNTTITSNRAGITSVIPTNNIITSEDDAIVWHIAKSGDNWTLYNAEANKYAAGNGTNNQIALVNAATADAAKWTVTRNEEEDTYEFVNVGNKASSKNANLRRNTGSGFACYASNLANSGALTLYKAGFTPAAALQSIEIKGDLEITEYFQGKSVKYDGLSVLGHYSDETSATITDGIEWSASPASFSDLGPQTITITATVTTKSGEVTDDAEFNVTVVESQQVNYGLVTNVATLYDGATIILGAVFGTDATPIYAVNQGFDTKYLAAYRSNIEGSDLEYADEVMKTAYASEITLKKVEGGWKLLGEDGKYINGAGDLSQTTDVAEATVWTISIEDGVTKIANDNNVICYNTSAPRFKTYTGTSQTVINCGIYMKNLLPVRTGLTAGKIGTICYPKAIAAVDGANLYQPNYKDDAVKNIYFSTPDEYSAGLPMIFQADREIMKVVFTGDEAPLIEDMEITRGMVGNLTDVEQTIDPGMYIFTQNKLWITGSGCIVDPNRAYVDLNYVPFSDDQLPHDLPSGAPRRTISLGNASASTPTGVNNLREGDAVNTAQKFFINGNIVIKNQGQLYNAQGNKLK